MSACFHDRRNPNGKKGKKMLGTYNSKPLQFSNYFPIKYISLDLTLAHKNFQMFLGFKMLIPSAPISPYGLLKEEVSPVVFRCHKPSGTCKPTLIQSLLRDPPSLNVPPTNICGQN